MNPRLVLLLLLSVSCGQAPAVAPDGGSAEIASCPARHTACQPLGVWRLQYKEGGVVDTSDRIEVRKDPAGAVMLTFLDRQPPQNECAGPTTPAKLEVSAMLSDDGCTLTVGRSEDYCRSGESQCTQFTTVLTLCGDGDHARGMGSSCRCWEPKPGCDPAAIDVQATRMAP
jgi:hypothetical protein